MFVEIPTKDFDAQSQLNPEQYHACTKIIQTIDAGIAQIFFVDGLGGTEKTYLYHALLSNIRSRGMIGLKTITSFLATSVLPWGGTTHLRF